MEKGDKQKGIEIIKQQGNQPVSVTGGGIRIVATGKPIDAQFNLAWSNVYMVLDCSGSMAGNKLDQARKGVIDFAKDAIKKNYLVGLIKFNTTATHLSEPTKEISHLEEKTKNLTPSGSTNMVDAIRMARTNLKNLKEYKVIVIATDGQPDKAEDSLAESRLAKQDGIEIIAIGTDDSDQTFLKQLASRNDLGTKVTMDMFAKAISTAYLLLPSPKSMTQYK